MPAARCELQEVMDKVLCTNAIVSRSCLSRPSTILDEAHGKLKSTNFETTYTFATTLANQSHTRYKTWQSKLAEAHAHKVQTLAKHFFCQQVDPSLVHRLRCRQMPNISHLERHLRQAEPVLSRAHTFYNGGQTHAFWWPMMISVHI